MTARPRTAFTLVECVLAISISALLMFGGAALLFDMSRLSESLESGGGLKSHADGVESFLRSSFSSSSVSDSSKLGETFASNSDKTVFVAKKPESMGAGDWPSGARTTTRSMSPPRVFRPKSYAGSNTQAARFT